jgi:hypothetical protein
VVRGSAPFAIRRLSLKMLCSFCEMESNSASQSFGVQQHLTWVHDGC